MTATPLIHFEPATIETATGEVAEILKATKARMGFVPNMYGYMGALPGVLTAYIATYTSFRETAGFTAPEQETVFLSVSKVNGCTYCMAAHSMIADKMSKVPADSLAALRVGGKLLDERLDALATFTRTMVETRGMPDHADVDAFLAAGFKVSHVQGIVLAIACKTFSNYTNHLAATEIDAQFADYKVD
jgi:uncharacterized peroxidase-related enzyme